MPKRTICYTDEAMEWFNEMCYFHEVCLPRLLRLCNDIKENPQPATLYKLLIHVKTIFSDFSQGNQIKFEENAGKQCVAISIRTVIYSLFNSLGRVTRRLIISI